MKNSFIEVMKNKSDEELVEIITFNRNEYRPEAITIAEDEIELRNLNIDEIKVKIEKNRAESNEAKRNQIFNKAYISVGLILVFPILFFVFSVYQEEILNIFFLPFVLLSFLPCGLIGTILAKREYNKIPENDAGINHIVGVIEIAIGILNTLVGFGGICLMIALTF